MFEKGYIFEALYLILFKTAGFVEFVVNICVYLYSAFLHFYHGDAVSNLEEVIKNVRKECKIPTHLTVLLGNENPSYKDLASLVMWSLASGIPYISFYDHKGILTKSEAKLQEAVKELNTKRDAIIWHNGENSCKNGCIGNKIYVRTLSVQDGRYNLVDTVKQVSIIKNSAIDQAVIESNLKNNFGFPDPDLGLYCGGVFKVFGFPPWQMRLTEFLPLETHHNINCNKFVSILYRFSKIEQRLGK